MRTPAEDREQMILYQLESRDIRDQLVLDAFLKVERHLFVPPELRSFAYDDVPLPIGWGQTISQPYVVAKMTELLALGKQDRVLEIGTGSGYQAAILAELAGEVYTIELVPELHRRAQELLERLGYTNIRAICGDGYLGYPEAAPYDAVIVTAAPPTLPENLVSQLRTGGTLVIPVGESEQTLIRATKNGDGTTSQERIFPVIFVPMKHGL